jgi:hypothetical protein
MASSNQRKLAVVLLLLIGIAILVIWWSASRNPKLTVSFLTVTNSSGRWIANFAITNVGDATAISFPQGKIEILGQPQALAVGCRPGSLSLSTGEGHIVQVFLPKRFDSRWRFTCLYARSGPKSRIYSWQWSKNGPGAKANWLVPQFLQGFRLDVNATSDWIKE